MLNFAVKKNKGNIMLYFFGSMIFRFFLSIILAFIVIYLDRSHSIIFAINFIVLYLLFLGFEIFAIITKLAPDFGNK